MKRIVIASLNPVKSGAVEKGFRRIFPLDSFEFGPVNGSSDVSDQPMSSKESLQGATNRANNARSNAPDADYWVGIEGGIEDSSRGMAAFAWIVILSKDRSGLGKSATFFLPEKLAKLVRGGMELGKADDLVSGRMNSKQKDGAIGLLTQNVVDRTALYEQGVIMALVSFKNVELYKKE